MCHITETCCRYYLLSHRIQITQKFACVRELCILSDVNDRRREMRFFTLDSPPTSAYSSVFRYDGAMEPAMPPQSSAAAAAHVLAAAVTDNTYEIIEV